MVSETNEFRNYCHTELSTWALALDPFTLSQSPATLSQYSSAFHCQTVLTLMHALLVLRECAEVTGVSRPGVITVDTRLCNLDMY